MLVDKPVCQLWVNDAPIAIPSAKLWTASPNITIHATDLSPTAREISHSHSLTVVRTAKRKNTGHNTTRDLQNDEGQVGQVVWLNIVSSPRTYSIVSNTTATELEACQDRDTGTNRTRM